jgi:ureidoacrylate peracid hydrolase
VTYKNRYSGFVATELETILKNRGITLLVITGCTTSVCVEATLRDAIHCDYGCLLMQDCTAEPGIAEINHRASLLVIERQFGWVSDSDRFAGAVAGSKATLSAAQ